jgi:hypothetical protein
MGWNRVTHVVDISDRIRWNAAYCAKLLLKSGASPDDVIEIRKFGRLVRIGLLEFVARDEVPRWVDA